MASNESLTAKIIIDEGPLSLRDILTLRAILEQHVCDRFTGNHIEQEIEEILLLASGIADELGRTRKFVVARLVGRDDLVGCMAYGSATAQLSSHCGMPTELSYELQNVFVANGCQGIGVGYRLLEHVCMNAKRDGKKWLLIQSGPRYRDSWGFYDKLCEACGANIPNAYGTGVDARTWIKSTDIVFS